MTQRLSLIASRGTDRLEASFTHEHDQIQQMIQAMDEASDPIQVLRLAGFLTLHNRAGYMPQCDSRPLHTFLEPDPEHEQISYSPAVVQMLARIFYGNYPQTYREWLHFVTLDERTFPYEALPMMLSLATRYLDTRHMTKRIIGSRGRWLIDHTTHRGWDWAKSIKPAKRPRLTKYGKQESRVIERLEVARYRRISLEATFELQTMRFPWSKHFSRILAQTFETALQLGTQYQPTDLRQKLDVLQWSIHPNQTNRISDTLLSYHPHGEYGVIRHEFLRVMTFRQSLRAVFSESV